MTAQFNPIIIKNTDHILIVIDNDIETNRDLIINLIPNILRRMKYKVPIGLSISSFIDEDYFKPILHPITRHTSNNNNRVNEIIDTVIMRQNLLLKRGGKFDVNTFLGIKIDKYFSDSLLEHKMEELLHLSKVFTLILTEKIIIPAKTNCIILSPFKDPNRIFDKIKDIIPMNNEQFHKLNETIRKKNGVIIIFSEKIYPYYPSNKHKQKVYNILSDNFLNYANSISYI